MGALPAKLRSKTLPVFHLPTVDFPASLLNSIPGARYREDGKGFFHRSEILGGQDDGNWLSVTGDRQPIMGAVDAIDYFRETVAGLAQGKRRHEGSIAHTSRQNPKTR